MSIKELIKPFYFFFYPYVKQIVLQLLFFFRRPVKRDCKYYFSICCIFKDEARYFREWIEFHRIVGVDHIYAYNNNSTDNYLEVLQPYIDEGFLTLIEWPYEFAQISAYTDCFNKFRNETYWLSYLDLDEFLCPREETDVKKWIRPFEKYPSIEFYWLMFGTNGVEEYNPNQLVIEQFTHSWKDIRNVGKIALNTYFEPVEIYHHHIRCYVPFLGFKIEVNTVNESGLFLVDYNNHKVPKNNTIQINHYWSKCISEYVRKINKGDMFDVKHDEIRKKMDYFYWHENQNVAENKLIFRFLAQLKMRMNGICIDFNEK